MSLMTSLTIAGLYIYPVKSLGSVPLTSVRVHRMGFAYDRRWMLVDESGAFLTQREYPRLAAYTIAIDDGLRITAPDGSRLTVPLDEPEIRRIPVTIWRSRVEAFVCAPDADRFFSETLGRTVRLVRIPEAAVREVDPRYGAPGDHVSFADGYPVLLTCSASLDDLNSRLGIPVPMDRFRPNVVLTSSLPFEEERWTSIAAPQATFRVVKPCGRCVITTTDQTTGDRFDEPLRTLATYRRHGTSVNFGMNCIPDGDGLLSVGDPVAPR